MPPPTKCRHHKHRFKKWTDLNSTAAAFFDSPELLFAGLAGFLSAGLAGSSEPTATASAPSGTW